MIRTVESVHAWIRFHPHFWMQGEWEVSGHYHTLSCQPHLTRSYSSCQVGLPLGILGTPISFPALPHFAPFWTGLIDGGLVDAVICKPRLLLLE